MLRSIFRKLSPTKPKVVKLVIDIGKDHTGEVVFVHASVVQGAEALKIGTDARAQVVRDPVRAEGEERDRARRALGRNAWRQERDTEKANRVVQQVRASSGAGRPTWRPQ